MAAGILWFSAGKLAAAERPQMMLVLDASGSMWQRIDDKEKILIARKVIGEILTDWNPGTDLGLVAYGHRRKGDCDDIETVVPVGSADVATIRRMVEGIQPKGKTPLSAAVLEAAEDLRYTEERATVILISDGKETCGMDPCRVGEELEKSGIDFTAHVIGFDIAEDEREQLQCLAQSTGGQYFDAREAEELKVALSEAVKQVSVQPDRVVAVLVEGASPLTDATIQWRAEPAAGGPVITGSGAEFTLPEAGAYTVDASLGQVQGTTQVEVIAGESQLHVVNLDAGRLIIQANVQGPQGAIDDPAVQWAIQDLAKETEIAQTSGPQASLVLPRGTYGVFARFEEESKDQVVQLEPGDRQEVSFDFEITLAELTAPDTAAAGSMIDVGWEGPDGKGDYLAVAEPDQEDRRYINYTYTSRGNPAQLQMPDRPGVFELRYVSGSSKAVLARRPIESTPVNVSLEASAQVPEGKIIEVQWRGPDNKGDYLAVAEPDQEDRRYINYTYTSRGNPAQLQMPDEAGLYELRYISGQSKTVLARRPIETTDVAVSLSAPEEVAAGKIIDVAWEGPDNKGDYLAVAEPDQEDRRYINYTYTSRGNPAQLRMPDEAGLYELRYVSGQSKTVLARRPITMTPVSAALRALAIVPVKEAIRLQWQGPDNKGDYLAVAEPGMPDNKYVNYTYTNRGDPAQLKMPDQPGNYELRYISGQSKTVLTRRPVQVVAAAEWPEALITAADGEVTLKAIDAGSGEPFAEGLSWTLYGIEGGQQDLQRIQEAQPQLVLPAGVYRANVTVDGASESLEFILNPGENITRTVTVQVLR